MKADAAFIAHARADVPNLVRTVRRLREEIINLKGALKFDTPTLRQRAKAQAEVEHLKHERQEILTNALEELARIRSETIAECSNIALAIDSGRGNEKEIARAILALDKPGAIGTP